MLVLTRKSNQSIMIGDEIEVSVLAIMGEKVRIGIQAPRDIPVFRKEVYLEIQQERLDASKEPARKSTRRSGASATRPRAHVGEALARSTGAPASVGARARAARSLRSAGSTATRTSPP